MSTGWIINIILLLILLAIAVYEFYPRIMLKRSAKVIGNEEFQAGMRKAQVIDVREKDDFNAGHIMGARNIPYSVLKQSFGSIRKDQPIYLYDQKRAFSARAANSLRKEGYNEIYVLKNGYSDWNGKIKSKKPLA